MVRVKAITKRIILLLLVFSGFLCYSGYLLVSEYKPSDEILKENSKIIQSEKVKQDETTKDFDEVIKKIEETRNNRNRPKQLEIEKQAKIAEDQEKAKYSQKPQKKEQKMTRYEDWIDEPNEAPPVEKLELEKIQWEGKPDER